MAKNGVPGWAAMAIAIAIASAAPAGAQGFDNKSVVALHAAGLGDTAITAKIASMPCGYDVTTEGLIALKHAGLADAVITAMVDRCAASRTRGADGSPTDPTARHSPGIYVLQDWVTPATLSLLRPAKASGVRVTGNGSVLMPFVAKLVLPDSASHMAVRGGRPTFFFYFDVPDGRMNAFGNPNAVVAQSPDEFTLVRLKVKGNQREVAMGKASLYGSARGIDPKAAIRLETEEAGAGTFKVTCGAALDTGEYAFVLTGANGSARVYPFTVN